ncbi:GDSL-type esterase/lipase family protein [Bacillus spongiae]|uniref:GDSL-type esterase/lipase family protein n=1 Tax=Bacillus spongiae TaxID=2683610 RepID=A0ABU8HFD5_9BACI
MKLVKIIAISALLSTILWSSGVILTLNNYFFSSTSSFSAKQQSSNELLPSSDLLIVGLGDSLTRGTGDTTGNGYISYMLEDLTQKSSQPIQLSNLAIKGYTSQQLVEQVQQSEVQRQIQQSTIILLSIGGNDLFQGGEALMNVSESSIDVSVNQYINNLNKIYSTLRSLNKHATIFHIGLYNPFSELDHSALTSSAVRDWNFKTEELAATYKDIIVVPTFDLFQLNVQDYLYSDQFHPNSKGYQLIGERISSLITFHEEEKGNE